MRKIQTRDVFVLARIIKTAQVKEKLAVVLKGGKPDNEVGLDAVMVILEACGSTDVENSFYELIGGIAEMQPDSVKELPISELIDIFKKMADENDLKAFFMTASK